MIIFNFSHVPCIHLDMWFRSGQSRRTRRDEAHDTRGSNSILQGAGNSDGRQTLHRRHRRLERRLYICRARHPADTVPRPRYGSTSKLANTPHYYCALAGEGYFKNHFGTTFMWCTRYCSCDYMILYSIQDVLCIYCIVQTFATVFLHGF